MIYVLGMSHTHSILKACSINGIEEQLPKISNEHAPVFAPWETKPDILPAKLLVANIHSTCIQPHWGLVLAQMLDKETVGIMPGYLDLLASIDKTEPDNVLFTFLHGEEYHFMSMRDYNAPFDYEIPWRPDLPLATGRQIVPYEVVERAAANYLKVCTAHFHALRTSVRHVRIVNVICPPPSNAGDFDTLVNLVRLKNYLVYQKLVQEAAARLGIPSLLPPAAALDETLGLLRKDYVEDRVHGNALYGELVLAQMRDFYQGQQ